MAQSRRGSGRPWVWSLARQSAPSSQVYPWWPSAALKLSTWLSGPQTPLSTTWFIFEGIVLNSIQLHSGSTFRGPYVVLGIEPRSVTCCKATFWSLWPGYNFFWKRIEDWSETIVLHSTAYRASFLSVMLLLWQKKVCLVHGHPGFDSQHLTCPPPSKILLTADIFRRKMERPSFSRRINFPLFLRTTVLMQVGLLFWGWEGVVLRPYLFWLFGS